MIDDKDVRHVARLARLALSPEEVARYREQLGKILESMGELQALDTASVPPTSHALGLTDVLRADEVRPFPGREDLLAGAPEREGPYFKVRKVIE